MSDSLVRLTAGQGSLRAFIAQTRDLVNEASQRHQASPVVAAGLGRLLTAGAMMGPMLKNPGDLVTLTVRGGGPVGGMVVTADPSGRVKGYAGNPQATVPNKANGKLDVGGLIGLGTLTVTRSGDQGEPYGSTVILQSGEIAEDLTYYFAQSEQTPSVVSLGVLVDTDHSIRQAGGFLIQVLPGAEDPVIDALEAKLLEIPPITQLFEEGHTPESIADLLFADMCYIAYKPTPLAFVCDCSREKTDRSLISLGAQSLQEMIDEDGKAEVVCHFCNEHYTYTEEDLQALRQQL